MINKCIEDIKVIKLFGDIEHIGGIKENKLDIPDIPDILDPLKKGPPLVTRAPLFQL